MTETSQTTVGPDNVVAGAAGAITPKPEPGEGARSLWSDAWGELRRKPAFWISLVLIVIFVLMAIVPQLFTQTDPYTADLSKARQAPSGDAWFGRDSQGYDVYARVIYGARASIMVGLFATIFTLVIGSVTGIIAGYVGGWVDAVIGRLSEIFLGIPLLLGGILFLYVFPSDLETPFFLVVAKVAFVLAILGWPSITRLQRSSVLQVKPNDYVQAARALGASPWRVITSHILPNSLASVIVVSTINLGAYIAVEATLSFLGIGLQPPAISWGIAISDGSSLGIVRSAPHMLLFPSLFLSLTVLAFIMLGDAVQEALDPKMR